jgi:ABC-type dipeptide/oligopeptide/nickel transport system permease subunit
VIVVELTLRIAYAIYFEAGLSFLGLGVQAPAPDWGLMVGEGQQLILIAPWAVIWPAVAIGTVVIGVNLLADGIKQATEVH